MLAMDGRWTLGEPCPVPTLGTYAVIFNLFIVKYRSMFQYLMKGQSLAKNMK